MHRNHNKTKGNPMQKENYMTAASGVILDYRKPVTATIILEDIATGLARMPRFCGHTQNLWTVAQHSMLVASLCPPELRLEALLHDATESFMADIPRGLKLMLPDYIKAESKLDGCIRQRFQLPVRMTKAVKKADEAALRLEAYYLTDILYSDIGKPSDAEISAYKQTTFLGSAMGDNFTFEAVKKSYMSHVREAQLLHKPNNVYSRL